MLVLYDLLIKVTTFAFFSHNVIVRIELNKQTWGALE